MKMCWVYRFLSLILGCLTLILVQSCAQKGRPSGGPKDITPPVMLRSNPDTFSTQVSTELKEIRIDFDEYIVLKDHSKNVLISPPIDPTPIFSPAGIAAKELLVKFSGSLEPETTYTINFGQCVQDNNEGNPLSYFTYVFSTGDHIDSLEINGKVNILDSRKMPENVIAALYKIDSAYNDSLIYTQKPYYVAKIDSSNRFKMKYLKEGEYKLIAFNDETANMQFDPKKEKVAFLQENVVAGDSQSFDLNLFQPILPYRALEASQIDYGRIDFYFEGKPEEVKIVPLNFDFTTAKILSKPNSDTISFYYNPKIDSIAEKRMRLKFGAEYQGKMDTLPQLVFEQKKVTPLSVYLRKTEFVPGKNLQIEANFPLDTLDKNYISVIKDSLNIDFEVKRINDFKFGLNFPIEFNHKYKVSLLPQAAIDFMQRSNDSIAFDFATKDVKNYGNLKLNLVNAPQQPYWLKLMDAKDKELESVYGNNTQFNFKNLNPGEYYFKLVVDSNGNQKYDTGDLLLHKQPEPVFIYPQNVSVKAYWDLDETWVLNSNDATENNETIPERKSVEELLPPKPN